MKNIPDCQYEYKDEQTAAVVASTCGECGGFILEGDEYYEIDGEVFCTDCIETFKLIAEVN